MQNTVYVSEQHKNVNLILNEDLQIHFTGVDYPRRFKSNQEKELCFRVLKSENGLSIETNYFVGVDWIIEDKVSIYIEPKLNRDDREVDFLSMLLESLEAPENLNHLDDLFEVDYDRQWISIPQKKDLLSPILIVQFSKLLQHIVKKGLKKSYYPVVSNLNGKVKGKILVGAQIRNNIIKSRLTKTVCQYQEFGENFRENQFLKSVLNFVKKYVHQPNTYFSGQQKSNLIEILNYCEPAFAHIDLSDDLSAEIVVKKNVFYNDYEEAIKIGRMILKKFSYNITRLSESNAKTPPFWVDMSKLFELYIYKKLKLMFPQPGAVSYHDKFQGGKETDILLSYKDCKAVIDCKYKPQYEQNNPSLEDKRQLAGYTRLKSVYDKLKIPYNEVVKGIIVFSSQSCPKHFSEEDLLKRPIKEYIDFYKLGVSLPEMIHSQ